MADTFDVTCGEALRTAAKWAMTADHSLDIIQERHADLDRWSANPRAWAEEITKARADIAAEEEYRAKAIVHAGVWAQIAQVARKTAGEG